MTRSGHTSADNLVSLFSDVHSEFEKLADAYRISKTAKIIDDLLESAHKLSDKLKLFVYRESELAGRDAIKVTYQGQKSSGDRAEDAPRCTLIDGELAWFDIASTDHDPRGHDSVPFWKEVGGELVEPSGMPIDALPCRRPLSIAPVERG